MVVRSLPYYRMVPKDVEENALYRIRILEWAARSSENRQTLWNACAQDILFYVNTFCFTFDPRPKLSSNPLCKYGKNVVPFVTYPYQDNCIMELVAAIRTGYPMTVPKCRTVGISWMGMVVMDWFCRFHTDMSFLVGSRKQEYVDGTDDRDALLPKIDMIHRYQPGWLRPRVSRTLGKIFYVDTHSIVTGEATNPNFGRSGRQTAIWLDEFAHVDDARSINAAINETSPCRLYVSTPRGSSNLFYELAHNPAIRCMKIPWHVHPVLAAGLYVGDDGKLHSPWYDAKCEECSPTEVAQEIDINWESSEYVFFNEDTLNRLADKHVRTADTTGRLEISNDGFPAHFVATNTGRLRLWMELTDGNPPPALYVIGVDVAAGTVNAEGRGYSNSVASVVNRMSGEKVAEYAVSGVDPIEFSRQCLALARWFKAPDGQGAFIIWETPGPGSMFGRKIMDAGYGFFWWKDDPKAPGRKVTDMPGYYSGRETKEILLSAYRHALKEEKFINHSQEAVAECRQYIRLDSGEILHAKSHKNPDPTGARHNHGDRVIADALASWVLENRPAEAPRKEEPLEKIGSWTWRRRFWNEKERIETQPWLEDHRRLLFGNAYGLS